MDDQARFEALYRAHAGAVRTYVARRCGAGAADDAVAEVFVVAWRRLDEVPPMPLPWLLGVARLVLSNERRSVRRARELVRRISSEQAGARSTPPEFAEPGDTVRRTLQALSERDREALLLVAWEGLEPWQAAEVLGLSANTFAARLHRARRRFARALSASADQADQAPSPQTRTEALR